MSGPVVLLGLSLAGSAILLFLHDRPAASSWLGSLLGLLLGLFALLAPIDEPMAAFGLAIKIDPAFTLLGRQLLLATENRAVVGFLYLAAGFLFLGGASARASRYLYSAGMVTVAALVGSLMVRPFLFAAVFLELAALAAVLVLVDPRNPSLAGAQRLLTFYTLGMLAILISGWLLQASGVTGGSPALVARVGRFLGLGFAVLLMVPPFHLWLPPAAEGADSYSVSFVAVLLYSAGFFFLLQFFNEYEWLRESSTSLLGVRLAGMVMIGAGSLWALAEHRLARAGAYVLLADLGTSLLVLGNGEPAGYSLALGISGARIVSLGVFAMGASLLTDHLRGQTVEDMLGAAYTNPLTAATMIVGLFSLAGAPLTAGFPGRWGSITLLAGSHPLAAMVLVLGVGVNSATAFRWLRWLLGAAELDPPSLALASRDRLLQYGGVALCLVLGLFPQLLYPWVVQTVSGLANLIG